MKLVGVAVSKVRFVSFVRQDSFTQSAKLQRDAEFLRPELEMFESPIKKDCGKALASLKTDAFDIVV